MTDISRKDFLETFEAYSENFGHSFTVIGLVSGTPAFEIAYIEMLRCLDGDRTEPITEKDIGLTQGEGVISEKDSTRADTEDEEPEPIPEEIIEEWRSRIPPDYSGLIEALDENLALSGTLAAGVLLTEWLFSSGRGRYLKPETREPLKQTDLGQLLESQIQEFKDKAPTLFDLSSKQWFNKAWNEVEYLHTIAFVMGRGGAGQLSRDDVDRLNEILEFQRQHLTQFKKERGESPLAEAARLGLYANSARHTFGAGRHQWALQNKREAERVLDTRPQVRHCEACPKLAGKRVPVDQLILPGFCEDCACGANCLCKVRYF